MPRKHALDRQALRSRLDAAGGKPYWRSLDELAETEEFLHDLRREFPEQADRWHDGPSRRRFLKIMGASLALAGLGGCAGQPEEKIVPYVRTPEQIVPGKPLYFATAAAITGGGVGLLVESHMGRPTKIEGNPLHPASLGASDVFLQAAILGLYDPDRSQAIQQRGQISTRSTFLRSLRAQLARLRGNEGEGLRVLTQPVTSPTLGDQLGRLLERFPKARWHHWQPVVSDNLVDGARLAFGEERAAVNALYHFDRADVVLSLDADFLDGRSYPIPYARRFMQRRRLDGNADRAPLRGAGFNPPDRPVKTGPTSWQMNRLYALETTPSLTGSKADHRLALPPDEMVAFTFDLARRLGIGSRRDQRNPALPENRPSEGHRVPEVWMEELVRDLREYRLDDEQGGPLVIAGASQPPVVQALVHAINAKLGSVGRTVSYTEPVVSAPRDEETGQVVGQVESMRRLIGEMRDGAVQALVIVGGNPVFDAPADFDFAEALQNVPYSVHLSPENDETSRRCNWHVPQHHFLESWSDVRAFDGTASVVQPLIAPLYRSWSAHELLSHLLEETDRSDYDLVRDYWRANGSYEGDFEAFWHEVLYRGVIPGTAAATEDVPIRDDLADMISQQVQRQRTPAAGEAGVLDPASSLPPARLSERAGLQPSFDVVFRPDPSVWDGRFAQNAWLQELPRPLTKLTWDNAALIGPKTAEENGLTGGDLVELEHGERTLTVPVWILPGQPERTVTVHFGYGRETLLAREQRQPAAGGGFDVYRFRTSDAPWQVSGVRMRPTGESYRLVSTQQHQLMEGRHLVRDGTLGELREHPEHPPFVHPEPHPWEEGNGANDGQPEAGAPSLYPPEWSYEPDGPQHRFKWAMVIDQNACLGCGACVTACQSENNIPVVGKEEVARGREMHWLRVDTYYKGDPDRPEGTFHQPVPCMHCENAPCEVVCPVAATTHSDEGLNEMTYNRCVGTRYCSNNCPYKVRRFNFLDYTGHLKNEPPLQLLQNPDVTVRSRGVMEKCTYCVQRLNAARIDAKKNETPPEEVRVQTACQQVCPTEAIVFGDLNAPSSSVAGARESPLNYALLGELNTQPRTTYQAIVRNPNERIRRELGRSPLAVQRTGG